MTIKAIIGLGNPGAAYYYTRHSIGFRVIDAFAQLHGASWRSRDGMDLAEVQTQSGTLLLVKSHTFMNDSGAVIPALTKRGIKPENILVIHDELELPFGKIAHKLGGSAKGHNGLKSIIAACGDQFHRLRIGIGRPENRDEVPHYVLAKFREPAEDVENMIHESCTQLQRFIPSV